MASIYPLHQNEIARGGNYRKRMGMVEDREMDASG